MSAVPEDFMHDPTHPPEQDCDDDAASPQPQEESHASAWQWLFIGVLLACWLAEATLCAGRGY